ncbi:MAG: archease [Deltaproteobacteria bacterium]|nr:archease [Deltaproteobacteria bacterium]
MKPEGSARRRPAKYRQLSHTADLAWRIWGGDLPELFENAAGAVVATMTDRRYLRRREKREITVESADREALLVDWLNHLLYLFDVAGFLGRDFQVTELTDQRLKATAWGERFDPERHPEKTAIKAATYHRLSIVRREDGWQATVILDL